jgi:metal transporter CNNM
VKQHHLLLVTLLLTNAVANEVLPLALDVLVPDWLAVLLSVTLVLLVSEILPSAVFTGGNQLRLGAFLSPLVWALIYLLWVVSYPLSKVLDCVVGGHDGCAFTKSELRALLRIHGPGAATPGGAPCVRFGRLSSAEVHVVTNVLDTERWRAVDVCTPMSRVSSVPHDATVDDALIAKVVGCGRSRVPVYRGKKMNVLGVVSVKRLLLGRGRCVSDLIHAPPVAVDVGTPLVLVLAAMDDHMAFVVSDAARAREAWVTQHSLEDAGVTVYGIVTARDVLRCLMTDHSVPKDPTTRHSRRIHTRREVHNGTLGEGFLPSPTSPSSVGSNGSAVELQPV